jgi:hypothetical protein
MVSMVLIVKALSKKQSNKGSKQESQVVSNKPTTKAKWPVVVKSRWIDVSEATGIVRIVQIGRTVTSHGAALFAVHGMRLVVVDLEMDVAINLDIITGGKDRVMLEMQIKTSAAVGTALTSMETRETTSVEEGRHQVFFHS